MADKTSFTKDEWALLLRGPMNAGMAVTAAFTGWLREIGEKTAEAASEGGGFFGGGTQVSAGARWDWDDRLLIAP